MTEAEWLACADPRPMLEFLRGKASDRKMRLFGCRCFDLVTKLPNRKAIREALQAADGVAEGLVTPEELKKARTAARKVWQRTKDYEEGEIGLAAEQLCVDDAWYATQAT